ncbi:hypothetical protein [Erythrobacter sp. Alg231-14]|uniref:hypothetical protein n=1 Tax=Erythrobacter sp. Alg231-14 TaxID=1922225 RepID=UPI00307C9552
MVDPMIMIAAAIQLILIAFGIWGVLSHVKEQRKQTAIMAQISASLAKLADGE